MAVQTLKITGSIVLAVLIWAAPLIGAARADVYARRDSNGVLHFTNVPSQPGYRVVIKEWEAGSPRTSRPSPRLEEVIRAASERHGVDPHLVRAVIKVESDFNSRALSRKGAQGLMQLMPETARLHKVSDVYDPDENIEGGVRHLKLLLDRYEGDLPLTLAAYNAGISAVERHKGVPPFTETKNYIQRVLRHYQGYRQSNVDPLLKQFSH